MAEEIPRPELVWPGKYTADGRRRRAERHASALRTTERYDAEPGPAWRNRLIRGDNHPVMSSLLDEFAGRVDLVYLDPPFATGADFGMDLEIGEASAGRPRRGRSADAAYRDRWAHLGEYLSTMADRLELIRDLLAPHGSLYLHCDHRVEAHLRLLLDEVIGADHVANVISWCYTAPGNVTKWFPRRHDTILWCTRSVPTEGRHTFNADSVRVPTTQHAQGRRGWDESWDPDAQASKGKIPEDWWADISPVGRLRNELVGYPTQKPEKLLRRIIEASSNPGDLVLDPCCGSGTTPVVAEQLGRRWIAADLGRRAVQVTRKRLLGLTDRSSFEVMDLGHAERAAWAATAPDGAHAAVLAEFTAAPGDHVHVAEIDRAVTVHDVVEAVEEGGRSGADRVVVLGWDWAPGIAAAVEEHMSGPQLPPVVLRRIPRELADRWGARPDVLSFPEVLRVDATVAATSEAPPDAADGDDLHTIRLTRVDAPHPELLPADVVERITAWSDLVDGWSVDVVTDPHATFAPVWFAHRTRQDRALALETPPISTPAGTIVRIRVVDCFGEETEHHLGVARR